MDDVRRGRGGMTLPVRIAVAFAGAFAVTFLATPAAISLAQRLRFFDRPEGYKGHDRPTPYLGGLALAAGFVAAAATVAGHWSKTGPLLGGVAVMLAVGTLDDRRTVRAWIRVGLELGLGAGAWAVGLGWHLHGGGALDLSLTCLWVVA